jgi:ATP-dependent helicase/nuclease subunit A
VKTEPLTESLFAIDRPARPAGARWTDSQWAGIVTPGNLLVSAAAGSGKTAVLAERCAYLVCDAPHPCDVDELLVVTFTEAAAAEMKGRIEKALRDRIASRPADKRLLRQLALIDRAQVSTLHGFCTRLIRQHFHLLDLDPAFSILDGEEAKLLRTEIARDLFAERYESADADRFRAFIDAYAGGYDEKVISRIIHTHELLTSVVDTRGWVESAKKRIAEPTVENFATSELGRAIFAHLENQLRELEQGCESAWSAISSLGGFEKYLDCISECQRIVSKWREILQKNGLDALASAAQVELRNLPRLSNSLPNKELAKSLVDSVRESIRCGPLRQILAFTGAQWCDGLARILPHAEVFLDLVQSFTDRYANQKAAMHTVDFADLERLALRALSEPGDLRPADSSAVDGPNWNEPHHRLRPSAVARLLHRQFAHVLVDEYQDINEVQDAILHLVSRECLEPDGFEARSIGLPRALWPNLFCVGDVKQAIYRFRLAEPRLFLNRAARFRNGEGQNPRRATTSTREDGSAGASPSHIGASPSRGTLLDLQQNFRSRAALLAAINAVFERLMSSDAADIEYDESHKLVEGARDYPEPDETHFAGAPIELHLLPAKIDSAGEEHETEHEAEDESDPPDRAQREALLVARRIRSLTGADGSRPMQVWDKEARQSRDLRFGDIVILLRSMKHKADEFADVLRRSNLPVHTESSTGYFDSMEIQDMLSLLKVLDNRAQDIPLAAVLRSPIGGLPGPEDALATIRIAYERFIPFHQAVVRYAREKHDELAAALRDILSRLDRWRTMSQQRPLAELIWDVYDSTGYLAFCAGLRDGEQRKANLIDLHDRARQFGTFQRQGLARFLAFLDQLREESDLGQPSVISASENVVRIMSIHRSKGLEFPVVVVPDLGKKINLDDCAGSILVDRHAFLGMEVVDEAKMIRYPSLASTLVSTRLRRQAMAEELRVLYVALTRAREHLILIGTCKHSSADAWQARWCSHHGRFPVPVVQGARCMLDWLGPVACATTGAIQLTSHSAEEISGWPSPEALRPQEGKRQHRLSRLERLNPDPSSDPAAQTIIARLTSRYPFERFTRLPAVEAATVLGKARIDPAAAPSPRRKRSHEGSSSTPVLRNLELPHAVQTATKPSAADIGEATHLVLQYLDFTQPCDESNLKAQIDLLMDRRLISPAAATMVDLDALCWLHASFVGQMLRDPAATVRRELSLYLALNSDEFDPQAKSSDPQDRVMVRSRVDVLIQTARGREIIDYKTDRITPAELAQRVESYRPQMNLYRRGIEALAGQPLNAVHLVFLHLRQIVSV